MQERQPMGLKKGNGNLLGARDKSKGGALPISNDGDKSKSNDDKPKSRAGRKPLAVGAKARNKVLLSFTDDELKQIEEAAGLIPVATFIKNALYNGEQVLNK